MSADTGWLLQIFFPNYNFIGCASKDGSYLATHPRVRANRELIGLGRF